MLLESSHHKHQALRFHILQNYVNLILNKIMLQLCLPICCIYTVLLHLLAYIERHTLVWFANRNSLISYKHLWVILNRVKEWMVWIIHMTRDGNEWWWIIHMTRDRNEWWWIIHMVRYESVQVIEYVLYSCIVLPVIVHGLLIVVKC